MKRFISILLSILLLISSAQVTYALHLCQGEVVKSKLVLGHTVLDCGMAAKDKGCETKSNKEALSRKCCENHQLSIDTDKHFQTATSIDFLKVVFIPFAIYEKPSPILKLNQKLNCSGLSPPKVKPNFQTDFQIFRI